MAGTVGGGNLATWSRNAREIFYGGPGNRIMVAEYQVSGDSFRARKPRQWLPAQILTTGFVSFDLAPDGKRVAVFLNAEPPAETKGTVHVTFLLNFFDDLRRRAPVQRGLQ